MTLTNSIEVSDGDVKHDIRESCAVVNTMLGAIDLMLAKREPGNTQKKQISKEIISSSK